MNKETFKILLIEDDPGDADLLMEILVSPYSGYEIVWRKSLKSATDSLSEDFFDVALLDLGLPESQGLDSLRKFLERSWRLPVVVLTGNDDESIAIEAVKAGVQDYIVKNDLNEKVISKSIRYALERRRLITRLEDSETKYRNIVETAREGIWTLDQNGLLTFVNSEMARMLDYTVEEMQGSSFLKFMDKEWAGRAKSNFAKRKLGVSERYEFKFKRKDQSEIWAIVSTNPILSQNGDFLGALEMVTDITDIKRMETERENLIRELKSALQQVKTLRGLLPVCANCKKVRDDEGYWQALDKYITDHSEAQVSHSICPDCLVKLYPEYYPEDEDQI